MALICTSVRVQECSRPIVVANSKHVLVRIPKDCFGAESSLGYLQPTDQCGVSKKKNHSFIQQAHIEHLVMYPQNCLQLEGREEQRGLLVFLFFFWEDNLTGYLLAYWKKNPLELD